MVQKSGDHQLRLVVDPIDKVLKIPGGFLAGLTITSSTESHDRTIEHHLQKPQQNFGTSGLIRGLFRDKPMVPPQIPISPRAGCKDDIPRKVTVLLYCILFWKRVGGLFVCWPFFWDQSFGVYSPYHLLIRGIAIRIYNI